MRKVSHRERRRWGPQCGGGAGLGAPTGHDKNPKKKKNRRRKVELVVRESRERERGDFSFIFWEEEMGN